jgi:hypothetical protein
MNLRKEKITNSKKPPINYEIKEVYPVEKDYPEIISCECQEYQVIATLSDGRIISIPTA